MPADNKLKTYKHTVTVELKDLRTQGVFRLRIDSTIHTAGHPPMPKRIPDLVVKELVRNSQLAVLKVSNRQR